VLAVEEKIAALEGAESALVFSSGQAATTTALLALIAGGDEVVCSGAIYGGTLHLLADLLPKFGIRPRFVSIEELRHPDAIFSPSTKLVWFESLINPTLRCVDIAAVAAASRAGGVGPRHTFASPVNQQPLSLGVDMVMHSATKYLNGHSDVTAGVLAASRERIDRILKARKLVGAVLDPYAAYALGRGFRRSPCGSSGRMRARWPWRDSWSSEARGAGLLSGPRVPSTTRLPDGR
jgi:cystathionine beta-lyase/cystathionine gamma-synthase